MIFVFFMSICCGYSFEAPLLGTSNEYHKICFHGGKKIKYQHVFVEKKLSYLELYKLTALDMTPLG